MATPLATRERSWKGPGVDTTLLVVLSIAVFPASALAQEKNADQDLRITLGGHIEDRPESGKLAGVCGTDNTRNVMNCDIYNGLLDWRVTVFAVVWSPYGDDNRRYYRVHVSIEPLKTEHMSVRLGLQLPPDDVVEDRMIRHWSWLIAKARGHPTK